MACNCGQPNCTPTVQITNCDGCQYTLNANCVIYNGDRLSYEETTITDGSARTLSEILVSLQTVQNKRESKIIEFNTDGVSSYTLVPEDVNKVLLLTQIEDGVVGTITNTIVLPQTMDFADCEIIIKNIATPIDTNTTTIVFQFNLQIQYEWAPAASTNLFATLDDAHKVVRLRFVKTTPTAYQWIVVS